MSGPERMPLHQDEMLEVNEFLVLDFVRERGRTTRPEICRELNLAASTVSRLVARLLERGAVVSSRASSSGLGRPAQMISFNHQAGCVLAIDLGGTRCRGAMADLAGVIQETVEHPNEEGTQSFGSLLASVTELRAHADRAGMPVRALAIGVPASIDPVTMLGYSGPAVRWDGWDQMIAVATEVGVPFAVENDVNLAALAQAWRGDMRRVDDFAVLSIGTGVGGGLLSGGRLLRGRHNAGGELGSLILDARALHRPPVAGGALEALLSAAALVRRAEERFAAEGGRRAGGLLADDLLAGSLTAEAVLAADQAGDPIARRVVDGYVDHLAMAVINVVAVADPDAIVFDGTIGRRLGPYLPRIESLITGRAPAVPRLAISPLGPDSTVVGAVAAALELARIEGAPNSLSATLSVVR